LCHSVGGCHFYDTSRRNDVTNGPGRAAHFTIVHGKIIEIDAIADPEHVHKIAGSVLDEPR